MPYIGKSPSFGVRNRFVYVASSGATSVSGADANGATLTFTDGAYVDVYLNGVLLKPTTDYNTSTANTIAGLSALSANDEVTVLVYDIFSAADTVSATSGGTFVGNVTMSGDATIGDDLTFSSDGAVLSFGADADVTLTHVADQGLTLKSTATDGAGGLGPILNLSTGDTDIAQANQLGTINFQAPNEGTGTDAVLVAASITAIANEDFAADANGTTLLLRTSDSGTNDGGYLEIKNDKKVLIKGNIELDRSTESSTDTVLYFNGNGVDWTLGTDASNSGYFSFSNNATLGTSTSMFLGASNRVNMSSTSTAGRLNIGFTHSTGMVGIDMIPDATTATMLNFKNSGGTVAGSITTGGSSTAFNTSSDYRLKENVSYDWNATSKLKQLKPARFNWIDDETNTLINGFLAHEVSNIVPEAVTGTKDGTRDVGTIKDKDNNIIDKDVIEAQAKKDEGQTWTKTKTEDVYQQIDQSKLVPLLVKTIQELEARVTALEEK